MVVERVWVRNYRSLRSVVIAPSGLTVIVGPNGSGKSNLYKALGLIAEAAHGRLAPAMLAEGGAFCASPRRCSRLRRRACSCSTNRETSLHSQLLAPLARLIKDMSTRTQVWVSTHSPELADLLATVENASLVQLAFEGGTTRTVLDAEDNEP